MATENIAKDYKKQKIMNKIWFFTHNTLIKKEYVWTIKLLLEKKQHQRQ